MSARSAAEERARRGASSCATGGIVLLSVQELSQTRSEAEPRGLGCFSREDSLPPCFRLLSTEQRSEWKPSPNMTSKPLQTMS